MRAKPLPIIAALLLLLGQAFAQPQREALLRQLKMSRPDTAQLRVLYAMGDNYLNRNHQNKTADLQNAKTYFLRAYHLADSLHASGYSKCEFQCKVAEVLTAQGQVNKAMAQFMEVAEFYHDHHLPVKEAQTYVRCVVNIWPVADGYDDIRALMVKALGIYEKLNRPGDIVYVNYWIAVIDLMRIPVNYYAATNARCRQTIAKYQYTKALNLDYVYSLLSRLNRYQGNLNQALSYSLKAMQIMKATNNMVAEELVYGELAQTYQDLGQTENSIFYYKKTIELREKKNMPQEYIFRTAGFVAQGLIKLKRPAEALRYIEALEKRHKPDNRDKYAFVEQVKAYCYEALKDYKRAEATYLSMIKDFKDDNTEARSKAEYDVASFYVHRKQFTKAALYLHDKSTPPNFTIAKNLQYLYFQVDSARGDFLSAIDHFRKYKTMTDSIFNVAKIKQIQELEIRYETDQKETDIKLLKSKNVIQQNNAQRATTQRNLTLGGIVILALLISVFYKSYRTNQQKNIILNRLIIEKDSILLEKDKLLVEKEWLLKEIHHRVKNNLQIVMGLLQRQSAYIDSDIALAAIQNSENRMHSIALIHQKLYQSDNLNMVYMPDYVDDFLTYLKDSGDLGSRILFEKQLDDISLHVSQAVPLGLILNEAVTNAIKHAYADDEPGIIHVLLRRIYADEYLLSIRDYGIGLSKDFVLEQADSMGMTLMRGLSKQVGGVFELQNNGGVTVSTNFKITPQDDHRSD